MAADTKDAPGKAPTKGFSLRSRLLGVPDGEPAAEVAEAVAESGEQPAADGAVAAAEAAASRPEPVKPDDEQDEEAEPPRVGVALAPRRNSLLASAFGLGERRKAEPKPDPVPEAVAEPVADVRVADPEPEIEVRPVEIPEPDRGPVIVPLARDKAPEVVQHVPVAPAAEEEPLPVQVAPVGPVPFVRFAGVKKTYDGVSLVVKDLNLEIAKGEFLTLLGPSGSGKTTTLMMLAGFETPTAGDIQLNGQSLTTMPPHKRGLGFVFQNYALFPHMTVAENLAFPLEVRKTARSEIKERVAKALAMVELAGFDKRKPNQLSGGQQQRIAVARALVFDPELVLMDEPLGALDKHLREQMQYELKRLHRELGVTVVYVTHDQGEALTLSDRIAVFHEGIIQQLDTPTNIYDHPANAFVAGFIGENNALPGKVMRIDGDVCSMELMGGTRVKAVNGNCHAVGQTGVVCVRPEDLLISSDAPAGSNHVPAMIEDFIFHGDHLRVKLSAPGMHEIVVKAPARANFPAKGVAVTLSWEPQAARAFVS
jgi:putative spermidine/putrescine transport system ATP-binding protein